MVDRPKDEDVLEPWAIENCNCKNHRLCDRCDGYRWYYKNKDTKVELSELMRDSFERHF